MIKDSKFYINELKTVVFLGNSNSLNELIKINKKFNLKPINKHLQASQN